MPGKQVKDWDVYHALRREGASKAKAARIANSPRSRKKSPAPKKRRKVKKRG